MAGFNSEKTSSTGMRETTNHHGEIVHKLDSLETLFSRVLGSFFGEGTHYEKRSAESDYKKLQELITAIPDSDKEYALKVAKLGRLCNMIQYPLEVLTVCFNDNRFKGESFCDTHKVNKLQSYSNDIIRRSKDILDILATQSAIYGFEAIYPNGKAGVAGIVSKRNRNIPLPMQLRKSLKSKIESYDEYKLSKGLGEGSNFSMADAIKILRPKPKNKSMGVVYKSVMNGDLKFGGQKEQIQSEMVKKGQSRSSNEKIAKAIVHSTTMAIIKNLVAMYKQGVFENSKALQDAVDRLTTAKEIENSRLLPFRFYSAYQQVSKQGSNTILSKLKNALITAMDLSLINVQQVEGNTATLIDMSGSMETSVSVKPEMREDFDCLTAMDVALVLGAIAYKKSQGDLYLFATSCKKVDVSNQSTIFDIVNYCKKMGVSGGTYLNVALDVITKQIRQNKVGYDNLIILSDNDAYGYDKNKNSLTFSSADAQLTKMIKDNAIGKVWINNLIGNDFVIANTEESTKNLITGFSEKFLNMISIYGMLGRSKDIKKVIDEMLNKLSKS